MSEMETDDQINGYAEGDMTTKDEETPEKANSPSSEDRDYLSNESIPKYDKSSENSETLSSITGEDLGMGDSSNELTEQKDPCVNGADGAEAAEAKQQHEASSAEGPIEDQEDAETDLDGWIDVLGNGLLKKRVITAGTERTTHHLQGKRPTICCCGKLEDGTVVDKQKELSFTFGDCDVIQGLDLCVALMKIGEKAELIIGAKYAYGDTGRDSDIPPQATLYYEVELLKVDDPLDLDSLPIDDRLKLAEQKKERGNYLFSKLNDFPSAITIYTRSLRILDSGSHGGESDKKLQDIVDMKLKLYNNMAACQLKAEAYDAAIRSCDEVLKKQPENVKALFRKGKAYSSMGETSKAISFMRKAIKLEPESKKIHQELSLLVNKLKKEEQKEQAMYKKMFGIQSEKKDNNDAKPFRWLWVGGGAVFAAVVSVVVGLYKFKYI